MSSETAAIRSQIACSEFVVASRNHHDQQKHPEHSTPAPADASYPTEPAAAPRPPLGWLGIEPTSLVFPLAVVNKITAALVHPLSSVVNNKIESIIYSDIDQHEKSMSGGRVSGTIRISIPSTRFFHDWKWNLEGRRGAARWGSATWGPDHFTSPRTGSPALIP